MSFVSKIFSQVAVSYWVKSYIISAALTTLIFYFGVYTVDHPLETSDIIFRYSYLFLNLILFPFAAIVWDDLVYLIIGDTAFILPIPVLIAIKVTKVLALYFFAVLIAPFGILYLWIRSLRAERY